MSEYAVIIYPLTFLYGILVGSFLNVCIYRIPKKESIVYVPSHCMSCGYHLKWFDLVPVFSWLFLGGKCRKCKKPISPQYPIIEAANGLMWLGIIVYCGLSVEGVLYCLLSSVLLVLSIIDIRTMEIPLGLNIFIALLGVVRVVTDYKRWYLYVIGAVLVSGIFLLAGFIGEKVLKKESMGGGDIKLMAAAGLLLGAWKIFLAMLIGCLVGVIVHGIMMAVCKKDHQLPFGPYLSAGILLAALFGQPLIDWYLSFF